LARRRAPVSIVTVFNDPEVRAACLDRSLEAHRAEAPDTEYLPVDNSGGAFASAGAALNHGAAQAKHDHVAFVHQDVYLHSLTALEEAAGRLADDDGIGMLGALGVTHEGRFLGRVRDRIFLLGDPAFDPVPVDTVDELLFMIPRRLLEQEPLPEDPEFAWHAYAVEYGLRARAQGRRVCAVDIPLTHNSLTANLDRLEVAYVAIAAKHPAGMPVQTPQGKVPRVRERAGRLRAHRWRYRWLLESARAQQGRGAMRAAPWVLADVRLDIDDVIARLPAGAPLLVISVDAHGDFIDERPGPLALPRANRPVLLTSGTRGQVAAALEAAEDRHVLLTNLRLDDVRALAGRLAARRPIMGFWTSLGYWALLGVPGSALPASWWERRATPLGMPARPSDVARPGL
jgi:hypothetical protein